MKEDRFFSVPHCERCKKSLKHEARTMSWFNDQTICMECSDHEDTIKKKLREQGKSTMEGCGYIPQVG